MRSIIIRRNKSRAFPFLFVSVFLTLIFVLSVVLSPKVAHAQEFIPAPTLISLKDGATLTNQRPIIAGLTTNGTRVDVFIDGKYDGSAIVKDHESGTASFSYSPKESLKPGAHQISALAAIEDNVGQEVVINIEVIGFVPPTLHLPVFNLETVETRPFIIGVARNDSSLKIYLDGEHDGEIQVKNHPSGTASFKYQPKRDLVVGMHQAYAVATNSITGQESLTSKFVTFEVKHPVPAPTLFAPTANNATRSRPNITGVAKNGSHVDVYINNVKHRVDLEDHPSGTTYFVFRGEENLKAGVNSIFAVAYSDQGRMSSKSNVVSWDLTPTQGVVAEDSPLQVEEPDDTELPNVFDDETTGQDEPDIDIDLEDRSDDAEVTIEDDTPEVPGEDPTVGVGTEDPQDSEEGEEEPQDDDGEATGTNWSKIIGLIILAALIIVLIIQLLKKEDPEKKKGETMDLFEGDKKDEKPKEEKEEKKADENSGESKPEDDDIPPPPPPSSNLPF